LEVTCRRPVRLGQRHRLNWRIGAAGEISIGRFGQRCGGRGDFAIRACDDSESSGASISSRLLIGQLPAGWRMGAGEFCDLDGKHSAARCAIRSIAGIVVRTEEIMIIANQDRGWDLIVPEAMDGDSTLYARCDVEMLPG